MSSAWSRSAGPGIADGRSIGHIIFLAVQRQQGAQDAAAGLKAIGSAGRHMLNVGRLVSRSTPPPAAVTLLLARLLRLGRLADVTLFVPKGDQRSRRGDQ